jgi:TonB family protein
MHQLLSSLQDDRERQFRRFVGFSLALHLALGILFWWSPFRPEIGTTLPAVVRVDLVTMADLAPVPKPAPAAEPKPPPPPPPPPPKVAKVLPKQPAPLPKPKPKPEPKPKPKQAEAPPPKVEPKPKEEPPPPEPAPEQDYDDVLAQLRKEEGSTPPKPVEQAAVAPGGGPSGPGKLVSPEVMRWIQDVKAHVTRAWILEPGFRLQPLVTMVRVDLGAGGQVEGTRITQSSGNPWYDESVERAIRKATPLPAPPRAGEWDFSFDAREL